MAGWTCVAFRHAGREALSVFRMGLSDRDGHFYRAARQDLLSVAFLSCPDGGGRCCARTISFCRASATIAGVRLLRCDRDRRTGQLALRRTVATGGHFYTLLANTSVLSHRENGTRRDSRVAAALCRHVRLGKHGRDRRSRLSRSSAAGATGLRDPGGKLWRGGRDRLLRSVAWTSESDQRPQQLFSVGAAKILR